MQPVAALALLYMLSGKSPNVKQNRSTVWILASNVAPEMAHAEQFEDVSLPGICSSAPSSKKTTGAPKPWVQITQHKLARATVRFFVSALY